MRIRDYRGPLGVLTAGAIGISLLCSVSALAMSDLSHQTRVTVAPLNIVDLAVSNLSTVAAMTQQAVTQFVPTPTATSNPTSTASPTVVPSNTPKRFVTATPLAPKRTRQPADNPFIPPANTSAPPAPRVQPTDTAIPPTDIPPTDIPPTAIPPTDIPPTDIPPTDIPPTDIPPTEPPATQPPATSPPVVELPVPADANTLP